MKYILSVDQSTQGTKALLFDESGGILARTDKPHRQIVNEQGWVEHDPEEIWLNTLSVIRDAVSKSGIEKADIAAIGISNQRETTVCWDACTGKPVCNAIVWQCARASAICEEPEIKGAAGIIQDRTGLHLSPYFPAAKLAWIFRNVADVREKAKQGRIRVGTIDSWLIYRLTNGQIHATDYSNASRTQLFNIQTLKWDEDLLGIFGIDISCLPEVKDSDSEFGLTDFDGWLEHPIPIHAVLGDSHAALLGQGCLKKGMTKATYGTGSSIMMNAGEAPLHADSGAVVSLAWKLRGRVNYVLEGNINYTGAVVSWLKDDVKLISDPSETETLARGANPDDTTYLVPAFSGLGAPYWDSTARAVLCGMSRTTGKNEIVKAALDSIAYQIRDVISAIGRTAGVPINELRVDGGATRNEYLMQFQSDILGIPVYAADAVELSGTGAAYAAGLALGIYDAGVFERIGRRTFEPGMPETEREIRCAGWQHAIRQTILK